MRTLTATLLAEQVKENYTPVVNLHVWCWNDSEGYQTYETAKQFTKADIISLTHKESPWDYNAQITFDNADGYFTTRDFSGYNIQIGYGAHTDSGDEYSDTAPLIVISQQNISQPSRLVTILYCVSPFYIMARNNAENIPQYTGIDATWTVKDILTKIVDHTLVCFLGHPAYDIIFDSEDSVIDSFCPAASSDTPFIVNDGDIRMSKIKELITYTKCVMRWEDDTKFHVFNPTISGTSYDYTYTLTGDAAHKFFSKDYRKRLVIPNYISVINQYASSGQYSGSKICNGIDDSDTSYSKKPVMRQYITGVKSDAEADAVADGILQHFKMDCETGNSLVPMNFGQEIWDYINIVDSRSGDSKAGNIQYLIRQYDCYGTFTMQFHFGTVHNVIDSQLALILGSLGTGVLAEGEDTNVTVKQLKKVVKDIWDVVMDVINSMDNLIAYPKGGTVLTPTKGTTIANWNTSAGTSGSLGADLVTIGSDSSPKIIQSFWLDTYNLAAGGSINIRLYHKINSTERKTYDQTFTVGQDPTGLWIINGSLVVSNALRVEVYTTSLADNGKSIGWEYVIS